VFETFVIVKGKSIWNTLVDATVTEWNRAGWKARLLFFLIIALIGGMAAQRLIELQRLSRLATVVTVGAVSSLSIPFLTLVTPQTMTEEIMAIQMAAVLLLSLAAAHLIRATARYRFANSKSTMVTRPAE
jgi:biotin transporter BioY